MSIRKHNFPFRQNKELTPSRREFGNFLGGRAAGFGCATMMNGTLLYKPDHSCTKAKVVADLDEIQIGESNLSRYPTSHDLANLVRLSDGTYRAYDQRWTSSYAKTISITFKSIPTLIHRCLASWMAPFSALPKARFHRTLSKNEMGNYEFPLQNHDSNN